MYPCFECICAPMCIHKDFIRLNKDCILIFQFFMDIDDYLARGDFRIIHLESIKQTYSVTKTLDDSQSTFKLLTSDEIMRYKLTSCGGTS